ncbi:MAG: hypothetical protein HY692_04515 [Cyanobacteria bacterium NC_groundwater_1444_Ag_S-0.65um_54_12]|nr:hypothetical protein [Cyanobacteria bacterium NC_groundwater_1444_Ag_S-0.65um_54_12]
MSNIPETVNVRRKGTTIGEIARQYGISVEQLKQLNPRIFANAKDTKGRTRTADGHWIYIHDTIRLRPSAAADTTTEHSSGNPDRPGDARKTVEKLLRQQSASESDTAGTALPPVEANKGMSAATATPSPPTMPPAANSSEQSTPLPLGPLPAAGKTATAAVSPPAASQPRQADLEEQFHPKLHELRAAIDKFLVSSREENVGEAETARKQAKALYTEAAKLVGQMDRKQQLAYRQVLGDFEDKLQYHGAMTREEILLVREATMPKRNTTEPASNHSASANQTAQSGLPTGNGPGATNPPAAAVAKDPEQAAKQKIRAQLAGQLPQMDGGTVKRLSPDVMRDASSEQRATMLVKLLDHWWVGDDSKKSAADLTIASSVAGDLEDTFLALDQAKRGKGVELLVGKLAGADRRRVIWEIFGVWEGKPQLSDRYLARIAGYLKKDDIRTMLRSEEGSKLLPLLPPTVKEQFAKILSGGWLGKSAEDKALLAQLTQ